MSRIITNVVTLNCDMCDKKIELKKPVGAQGSNEWADSATEQGWFIVMSSPVPFNGLDLCPSCIANIKTNIGAFVEQMYKIIIKRNEIGSFTVLRQFMSQLSSNYMSHEGKEKENKDDNVGIST